MESRRAELSIQGGALRKIINNYTKEAGVRKSGASDRPDLPQDCTAYYGRGQGKGYSHR